MRKMFFINSQKTETFQEKLIITFKSFWETIYTEVILLQVYIKSAETTDTEWAINFLLRNIILIYILDGSRPVLCCSCGRKQF